MVADAVYLTPIFTAYSNHKYDTVDYQSVDPMFGDESVLGELIDELHKRGMRLIMDAVLNHVGTEHPWFQAAKRGEVPYRDFFTFFADGKYLCWWGYDRLPELRIEHPLIARMLYRDPDSVLQRWLARRITTSAASRRCTSITWRAARRWWRSYARRAPRRARK
jgi:glycosidase